MPVSYDTSVIICTSAPSSLAPFVGAIDENTVIRPCRVWTSDFSTASVNQGTTYMPPLQLEPIVADLPCPTGGAWLLAASGAVYAFGGAPFLGGCNGKPYFDGRVAASFKAAGDKYSIVATSGEIYGPGF